MSIEIDTPCNTIKVHIRPGDESGFIAECIELPLVTQGLTVDEVMASLREAISLHLKGEDLVALGFASDVPIVINCEMTIPLSPNHQTVAWWRKKEILIPFFGVVTLWLAAPFVVHTFFPLWAESGQFGDLFGSVNALFSGLAFVALIYTIYLQRLELSLQRIELKLQREEMVASRGELAAQVAVQKSLHRATIGQIRVAAEQARIEGVKIKLDRGPKDCYSDLLDTMNNAANKIDAMADNLENG